MVAVAVAGGLAVAAALAMLIRRERAVQLVSMGVVWLALAVAMLISGAALPAIVMVLAGLVAGGISLASITRGQTEDPGPRRPVGVASAAVLGVLALAVLLGAGVAGRDAILGGVAAPSLSAVARAFLLRTGVPALGVVLLAATVVIAGTVILRRDSREAQEEQAELGRRRRVEEQRRRAERREAARAASRAQRRGGRT